MLRGIGAVAVLLSGMTAYGGDLRIWGDDAQWSPSGGSAFDYVVSINNTSGTQDPLIGWQMRLEVQGRVGSSGRVWFESAAIPTDYVLEGHSAGLLPSFSGPADVIPMIGDSDPLLTGVVVPSQGAPLMALRLDRSDDAMGVFDFVAFPGQFDGSSWFSSDVFSGVVRDFENVPFGGGPVAVGSVSIVAEVPEPAGITLLLLGVAPFAFWRWYATGAMVAGPAPCAIPRLIRRKQTGAKTITCASSRSFPTICQ